MLGDWYGVGTYHYSNTFETGYIHYTGSCYNCVHGLFINEPINVKGYGKLKAKIDGKYAGESRRNNLMTATAPITTDGKYHVPANQAYSAFDPEAPYESIDISQFDTIYIGIGFMSAVNPDQGYDGKFYDVWLE